MQQCGIGGLQLGGRHRHHYGGMRHGRDGLQQCCRLRLRHSSLLRCVVQDGAAALEAITQRVEALFRHVQDGITLGRMIFSHTFQVIFDTGDGISQHVQALPVRHGLAEHQLLAHITATALQQGCSTRHRNHGQPATHLIQQLGHIFQMLVVPLRTDEFDDGVLGLLKAIARFLDHQLMNLIDVRGRHQAGFADFSTCRDHHRRQAGFHKQQATGQLHQDIVRRQITAGQQVAHDLQLVSHHLALTAQAQHAQRVGNLAQQGMQWQQGLQVAATATHKYIQAFLDPRQILVDLLQCRPHAFAVGAGQTGTLLVDRLAVRHGFAKVETLVDLADARTVRAALGDIEQQILQQVIGGRLVERDAAIVNQALELPINVTQQGTDAVAQRNAAIEQTIHQRGGNRPQRPDRRVLADDFQLDEHLGHEAELGGNVLVAHHANQCHLQHLAQLAQQGLQAGTLQALQCTRRHRVDAGSMQIRIEQAGFRQQALATGCTQVIEQRQDDQRQVATGLLDTLQIDRQLLDGLRQGCQRVTAGRGTPLRQGMQQLLHFLGEQGCTVELDHLQGAMHLMDVALAEAQARHILRVLDERIQGLTGLLQRFGDFTLDPLQGDIVVPITHSDSTL